jgi:hypothetical protein
VTAVSLFVINFSPEWLSHSQRCYTQVPGVPVLVVSYRIYLLLPRAAVCTLPAVPVATALHVHVLHGRVTTPHIRTSASAAGAPLIESHYVMPPSYARLSAPTLAPHHGTVRHDFCSKTIKTKRLHFVVRENRTSCLRFGTDRSLASAWYPFPSPFFSWPAPTKLAPCICHVLISHRA